MDKIYKELEIFDELDLINSSRMDTLNLKNKIHDKKVLIIYWNEF